MRLVKQLHAAIAALWGRYCPGKSVKCKSCGIGVADGLGTVVLLDVISTFPVPSMQFQMSKYSSSVIVVCATVNYTVRFTRNVAGKRTRGSGSGF